MTTKPRERVAIIFRVDPRTAELVRAAAKKASEETGFNVSVSEWVAALVTKSVKEK